MTLMQKGVACLVAGFALALVLSLQPGQGQRWTERVLGQVLPGEEAQFTDDFGGVDRLLSAPQGRPLTPYLPDWMPHPAARGRDWLLSQSPDAFTVQVGVFSSSRAIKELLDQRTDADRFAFVRVARAPVGDEAAEKVFVLTYGSYASAEQAAEAADQLMGTGEAPLIRNWAQLQAMAPAPTPETDALTTPPATPGEPAATAPTPSAPTPVEPPADSRQPPSTIPVTSLPFRPS